MNGGVLIDLARRIFVKNFYLKFIAVILTLALYIWVSEDREIVTTGHAPVQILAPAEQMLVSDPIDQVSVEVRGRWSDVERLETEEFDPVRLDLGPRDDETVVSITSEMINVPPELEITDIEPDSMYVELQPEEFKTVPVNPQITGSPRTSYSVEQTRVDPETITVRGPENQLRELDSVQTEPIDISGRTTSLEREVRPRIDERLISPEDDEPIVVEIDIDTEEISEVLADVPVEGVNTSYAARIEPSTGEVGIEGPKAVIEEMNRELIRLEIDLSDEDDRPPGTYSRSAEIVNLPADVDALEIHPERFRVVTEPDGDDESPEPQGDEAGAQP